MKSNKDTRKNEKNKKSAKEKKDVEALDNCEEKEDRIDTSLNKIEKLKENKIHQSTSSKKELADLWQVVSHVNLTDRKVTTGTKIKAKNIKGMKITSLKNFSKALNKAPIVPHTSLKKRKATALDATKETIPEIIKDILKDYNSIAFLTQPH